MAERSLEAEALERIKIVKLEGRTVLDLSNFSLKTLPAEIWKFTNLEILDLGSNQLTSLPAEIARLTNLNRLYLDNNRLTLLPAEIERLTNLRVMRLDDNQLMSLPAGIGRLTRLGMVWLDNNQLTSLPAEIGRLELEYLYLDGNPLTDPPPEVVKQGTEAILTYLRGRLEESRRQWISKMLVVGEGGVGKTCLLDSLHGREFDTQSETTHGIRVEPLELAHPRKDGVTMTLNTWDFGGQQIYHATHQFFLTTRSLYLLVWNARLGFEQGKLYYWLDTIKALAPDSPVLIVATHIDQRAAALPLENMRRKYPQIVGVCEISNKERIGIDRLVSAIAEAAAELPLMGGEWPAKWLTAAEAIRKRPENQIAAAELKQVMAAQGVTGESQEVLTKWLHELGDILYFADDDELRDTVLLNSQWVTENISKVLECDEIKQGLGIFRREHMDKVWEELDATTRERFLRLMEKFDLSYRIPDDPENKSLVVERLSLDPADYEEKWEAIRQEAGCKEVSMRFDLGIARPAGIPTWFIARAHRFTTNTHWLYGALFTDHPEHRHLALVSAPPSERYVTLTVRGPSPYSFFALLKDGLEVTLERFKGLRPKLTVPCPGHGGQACEHEFDYKHLQGAIEREPPVIDIQCPVGLENVFVPKLLFGIHWTTRDDVLKEMGRLREQLREHDAGSEVRARQLLAGQENILVELDELRELTQREFTNQFKREQRLAESHCPSVFSLRPVGQKTWPVVGKLLGQKWNLHLYCEYPGCWHPTQKGGEYEIKQPAKWLSALGPHVRRLLKVFKFVTPLVGPWLAYGAPEYEKLLKRDIDLMKVLVDQLPSLEIKRELMDETLLGIKHGPSRAEGASLRGLRRLLDDLDPPHNWGGLKKVLTPEGHYLWLCDYHAEEFRR